MPTISRRRLLATAGAMAAVPNLAEACSRIYWNDNPVKLVGRTLDWNHHFDETIWVLPRGMQRAGILPDNPARWTSKHGSVVVAANDRAAVEGINEHGLVVSLLFLDRTQYAERDAKRPGIAFFQWAQFYLDNFASVQEVLGNLDRVQIVKAAFGQAYPDGVPLHAALADPSGDSAIVEFIAGDTVVHFGRAFQVMTNDPTFDEQLANQRRYKPFGGQIETLPGGVLPEERFVRAAYTLKHLPKSADEPTAVANMLSLLANISVPFGTPYVGSHGTYPTWWRSVINVSSRVYYLQTTVTPNVFWLDLAKLAYGEGAKPRRLSIFDAALLGEVSGRLAPAAAKF